MVQLAALIACQALERVPGHARRRAHRRASPLSRPRRSSTRPSPTWAWARRSTSCTPPTTSSPSAASRCRCPGQSTTTPETRAEHGLAVQRQIVGADRVERMYAKAARRRAAHPAVPVGQLLRRPLHPRRHRRARRGSCSPSRCWSPSAAATRRCAGTSPPTSTSATTAAGCSASLTQLLPFIGYPRTLNALRAINEVAPAQKRESDMTTRNWLITGVSSGFGPPASSTASTSSPLPCAWSLAPRPSPARWLPSAHASPTSRPRPSSLPPPTTQPATSCP